MVSNWHSSLIDWELAFSLSGNEEKNKIATTCKALHTLLSECSDDELLKLAFQHFHCQ